MGKLGENIKRIREGMGLSQRQFGELIGKSDSQIWSYENDRTDILASTLYKIAEVANVDFNNLMAGIIPEEELEKKPDSEWDAELRIYNMEDRLTVIKILAKNGYDVGQNKRQKGKGNSLDYFVHAKDLATNADTSKQEANMEVRFTIRGEPKGKGRPRFCRNTGHAITPKDTVNYETLVRTEYSAAYPEFKFPDGTMLDMRIMAYYSIPKSASKKKKASMLANEIRPTKKPDMDNVVKIIADSLNQVAYRDDTQIVDCQCRKFYSETPRVEVIIRSIEPK